MTDESGAADPMSTARVLLVDDDPLYVRRACRAFGDVVDLQVASNRDDALLATEGWFPDVVVVDMLLGDADAFRLLDELRMRCRNAALNVVYLAKGPGSIQRWQSDAGTFLGVVKRESGIEALREVVVTAIRGSHGVVQPAA
jgi:CheY-like chemotaxis protein